MVDFDLVQHIMQYRIGLSGLKDVSPGLAAQQPRLKRSGTHQFSVWVAHSAPVYGVSTIWTFVNIGFEIAHDLNIAQVILDRDHAVDVRTGSFARGRQGSTVVETLAAAHGYTTLAFVPFVARTMARAVPGAG